MFGNQAFFQKKRPVFGPPAGGARWDPLGTRAFGRGAGWNPLGTRAFGEYPRNRPSGFPPGLPTRLGAPQQRFQPAQESDRAGLAALGLPGQVINAPVATGFADLLPPEWKSPGEPQIGMVLGKTSSFGRYADYLRQTRKPWKIGF